MRTKAKINIATHICNPCTCFIVFLTVSSADQDDCKQRRPG